jgi:hypothetical protein
MFDFGDAERIGAFGENRNGLATLLARTGEKTIELYGLWWGNFAKEPLAQEDIPLHRILEPDFVFEGAGFLQSLYRERINLRTRLAKPSRPI